MRHADRTRYRFIDELVKALLTNGGKHGRGFMLIWSDMSRLEFVLFQIKDVHIA
jgi:hypothetical protein